MELQLTDILQGTFSIIFAVVTTIIGIKILSKYFGFRDNNFLFVGIGWIGMGSTFFGISTRFIVFLLSDILLIDELIFLIVNPFLPIPLICWLIAMTNLLKVKRLNRNILLMLFVVFSIIFEVMFFYYLLTDPRLIGRFTGILIVEWSLFSTISFMLFIGTVLVSGMIFAYKSLKSQIEEIVLKGKLLLLAFISFTIYGAMDLSLPSIPLVIIISRLILVSSSIVFYMGFMLPKWTKRLFIKEK